MKYNKPSELGKYIKSYRNFHHLRQIDLSTLSKKETNSSFSKTLVWSIERGYRKQVRNLGTLKSLSIVLHLPIDTVYKMNGYPKHPSTKLAKRGYIIGEQLRETGLSTQQIANKINISITTVDSWLRGHLPSFEADILLVEKLHINIGTFDATASTKIHKLFNAKGIRKFKLLRLLNGWSLNDVFRLARLKKSRTLLDVETGRSFNFNTIYHLANLYHIHIRAITNHKFSLYQIYKVSNTTGNRLLILRHLKGFTLKKLRKSLDYEFSIKELNDFEHNFKLINVQLIGGLAQVYKLPFWVILNFLGYKIDGTLPNNRQAKDGLELKKLRNKCKLTLNQVSKSTDYFVNRSALSSCENGKKSINVNILPYLANTYHVPLKDLLAKLKLRIKLNNKGLNIPILNKYKV